jgi:hypothetical protein
LLLVALGAFHAPIQAASPATEGWDSGSLAGWEANTLFSIVSVQATGGNPNGYILDGNVNSISTLGIFTVQEPWTGDFAAARIVQIQVDLRFFGGDGLLNPRLRFRQSPFVNAWSFELTPAGTDDGLWHHYEVAIDPSWSDGEALAAGWLQEPGTPSFAATMASVGSTEVRADGASDVESIGVDNFTLIANPSLLEIPAVDLRGLGILAVALALLAWHRLSIRRPTA